MCWDHDLTLLKQLGKKEEEGSNMPFWGICDTDLYIILGFFSPLWLSDGISHQLPNSP